MNKPAQETLFSSNSNEWATPQEFFDLLDSEFHFSLDVAATSKNAKCSKFFTKDDDALTKDWSGECVWCNPPYGRSLLPLFVMKASGEVQKPNTTVVLLIPARTDTRYWHEYIFPHADEIRFIRGRLSFGKGHAPAPFPSAIVIFKSARSQLSLITHARVGTMERK